MRITGFIDLPPPAPAARQGSLPQSIPIHLFRGAGRSFEFEKSVDAASVQDIAGVGDLYLSLPLELLNFRVIRLPFSDREKVMKVIPFELGNYLMTSTDEVVFDALIIGGPETAAEVLVTYIERGVLGEILAGLASKGLDPRVVTSIDLRAVAGNGTPEDIPLRLMNPERLRGDDRFEEARHEISGPVINLRTGPFAYTKDIESAKKSLRLTAALLTVLALIGNAYLTFSIVAEKREAAAIRAEMRSAYTALFPGDKKVADELYQMKSHLKEVKGKGEALIGVYPLQTLLNLSQRSVKGVVFNEVSLDRELLTIKGEASSVEEIDRTKKGLLEFLTEVTVSDIKPSAQQRIFFTVIAKGYRQ